MEKYNERLLPNGYFSREAVPYWGMVVLDCITIVLSGVAALYIVWGGLGVVFNIWDCLKISVASLPIFLLFMHIFRTYVGTLTESPFELFKRLVYALCLSGVVIRLLIWMLPEGLIAFLPGMLMIGITVLLSLVVQFAYRMAIKMVFRNVNNIGNPLHDSFYKYSKEGRFTDTTVRARKKINLCLAHMSEDGMEQKYVQEAFDTNWVVPLGPNVNAFEADLEQFVNVVDATEGTLDKHVVALSAGTAAVHLALRSIGVMPGDEVIVQSFTFCASANPVAYVGAIPIFVDSEPETWNMDPELLEKAIKDRIQQTGKKPKAIIPVALYGMPYQVDKIMAIANKYEIPVIEDAAEGFGSKWKGQVLGTFGQFGVLSFNGNKMITTSGGGALVCSTEAAKKNVLWFATQAREAYPYYQHEAIGYNYRMSNVCAGIGRGQMTVVDDHIAHHKHVQHLYEELLKDVSGIHVHTQPSTGEYDSNYWLCAITIDESVRIIGQENAYKEMVTGAVGGAAGVTHVGNSAVTDCQPNANVEALRIYLDNAQIEARPVWKPMHKQPVFAAAPVYVNGVSEAIFKVGMCLPAGPCVTDEDVRYIVDTIKAAIVD